MVAGEVMSDVKGLITNEYTTIVEKAMDHAVRKTLHSAHSELLSVV